jgi:transketolase
MNAVSVKERKTDDMEMRDVYCKTLIELAAEDKRIVVLDADLMNSMGMVPFLKSYPQRTFDVGIQEANMIGVAAGLSATGKIPFAHSFATFASRRCFDQVFLSCGYAKLNVKIIGSDPGITAAYNGGTHMPFEDIGLMRNIPDITILEPVDSVMLKDLVRQAAGRYGVHYIRLLRKKTVKIYENGSSFEIGKGITLKDGKDVTVFATGIMVDKALSAAVLLEKENISARVVNIFTIKPVDEELIVKCAKETGAVVSAENHNVISGLGAAVADVLVKNYPVPMEMVGVNDLFGEVGSQEYLIKRFSMTAEDIASKVRKVIKRKS